jgi:hypothetical protein
MPSHHRGIALTGAILVLLVACLAGCGGSKSTSSAGGTTSSASSGAASGTRTRDSASTREFIARAEAICRETNARLVRTGAKRKGPHQLPAAVVENQSIERGANRRLAQIGPPADLAPAWRKMLGYRRVLATQLGLLAAAAKRQSADSVKSLGASKKKLHNELRRLAKKSGFTDCAKVGSS